MKCLYDYMYILYNHIHVLSNIVLANNNCVIADKLTDNYFTFHKYTGNCLSKVCR